MTGSTKAYSSAPFERWIHWYAAPAENTRAPTMEAMPNSAPFIGMRLPKKMMSAKATAGISGMT